MYCQNCGKQIDDKAVVCVGCGVAVGKIRNRREDKEPFRITKYHVPIIISACCIFASACLLIASLVLAKLQILFFAATFIIPLAIGIGLSIKWRGHRSFLTNLIFCCVSIAFAIILFIINLPHMWLLF